MSISRLAVRSCLLAAAFFSAAGLGCVLYVEDTECGPFAYDYRGACYCEDGYEGDDPRGEGCYPVMSWLITDDCNDGENIYWKLYSDDRDWTWPSGEDVYVTRGYQWDSVETIVCDDGELICYGAETDSGLTWGVGLDFTATCDDCCFVCGSYQADIGFLTCP